MIRGVVNAELEATIPLIVQAPGGSSRPVEAVLDTGFNGSLTLPQSLIDTLGLPWLCSEEGELADGNFHVFDSYAAVVLWDGQPRSVAAEAVKGQSLIGMSLLRGSQLQMRVVAGGEVTITSLA